MQTFSRANAAGTLPSLRSNVCIDHMRRCCTVHNQQLSPNVLDRFQVRALTLCYKASLVRAKIVHQDIPSYFHYCTSSVCTCAGLSPGGAEIAPPEYQSPHNVLLSVIRARISNVPGAIPCPHACRYATVERAVRFLGNPPYRRFAFHPRKRYAPSTAVCVFSHDDGSATPGRVPVPVMLNHSQPCLWAVTSPPHRISAARVPSRQPA